MLLNLHRAGQVIWVGHHYPDNRQGCQPYAAPARGLREILITMRLPWAFAAAGLPGAR